jgi:hypothetical protein
MSLRKRRPRDKPSRRRARRSRKSLSSFVPPELSVLVRQIMRAGKLQRYSAVTDLNRTITGVRG